MMVKREGERSDCQFNLRGPELTDTTNFESTLWKENGYTEGCGVRKVDKTFIFKPPLVKVLYVISHCRISPHTLRGKQKSSSNQTTSSIIKKKKRPILPFVKSQIFEPWLLLYPPMGCMFSFHIFCRRGSNPQILVSLQAPPEMTFPMIDYFEPFSGYIIAGLSSSLYSPYRHSIAAKPQIESCNYPDCHLIAALLSALSLQVLLTHHRDRGKKRPACGTARHR